MGNQTAELILVPGEDPHADPIERPEEDPRCAPLEITAQPQIEHVFDAVAEALSAVGEEEMLQKMIPGCLFRMPIQICPPMRA